VEKRQVLQPPSKYTTAALYIPGIRLVAMKQGIFDFVSW